MPLTTPDGAVLVIERSAEPATVLVAVALLFAALGSVVALLTDAVLFNVLPPAAFADTWAVIVKLADAPDARLPIVSLIELPEFASVKAGPAVWV